VVRLLVPPIAAIPIDVTDVGIVNETILVRKKVATPIEVTLVGIVIEINDKHLSKAELLIDVTLLAINTLD